MWSLCFRCGRGRRCPWKPRDWAGLPGEWEWVEVARFPHPVQQKIVDGVRVILHHHHPDYSLTAYRDLQWGVEDCEHFVYEVDED